MMSLGEKEKMILALADQEVYKIGEKEYPYNKITVKQFKALEKLKIDFRNEKDPEKASQLANHVLYKSAELYFGMTSDDVDESPREELGYALEAGAYRALFGKPFLSKSSGTGSGSEAKSEPSPPMPATSSAPTST